MPQLSEPTPNAAEQAGAQAQRPFEGALPLRPLMQRKGIFILPNLFTLAALFGGFYAIVMAMNGLYANAVVGVMCAMVLDALDGRVARMTNTQSAFGEQMDSLSDMVSFGVAPAILMYAWALKGMGKLGWVVAFIYCACAALRLARFNVNTGVVDKRFFQGLPSPAAAALVVGFAWIMNEAGYTILDGHDSGLRWFALGLTMYAGLTMVTNVPFYSFKDIGSKKSVPFVVLVLAALILALVAYDPATTMFVFFAGYGVSGYVLYAYRKYMGKQVSLISTSTDEPDEQGLHR